MEKNEVTIKDLTERVESMSTNFEKNNTELKKRYLIWNIDSFNKIASRVSVWKGTFGTGYPFYALDENLEGNLPIILDIIDNWLEMENLCKNLYGCVRNVWIRNIKICQI